MGNFLSWGILGTGNIARQFAAGFSTVRNGTAVAIGSRNASTAQAFAEKFGISRSHGSYEALIADPDVDAIYVSLPNSMHHEWTIRALRAGKHVLCEKPFATNTAQAQEMFDVAEQQGRVLMEAFMYRCHPMTDAVMSAVRSGAIGEVRLIRTSFCFRTSKIVGNVRFDPALAGGALMDVGCYCLNFSRMVAGTEPESFAATARLHERGVDELTAGTLNFPRGIVASFACSLTTHASNPAYICGTDGYIEIPVPWKPPREGATFTISKSAPPKMDGGPTHPPAPIVQKIDAGGDLYGVEADAFADTVLRGVPPRVTLEDTLGNMRLLDGIRRMIGIAVE